MSTENNIVVITRETGATNAGYTYAIRQVMNHLCGYISIPASHPWCTNEHLLCDVDVYGGITYGPRSINIVTGGEGNPDYRWIGFDTAHAGDDARWLSNDIAFVRRQIESLAAQATVGSKLRNASGSYFDNGGGY